jgi:hypothetical protein
LLLGVEQVVVESVRLEPTVSLCEEADTAVVGASGRVAVVMSGSAAPVVAGPVRPVRPAVSRL